jgi:uncharacterized protein YrzB (UPF0473 family)
MTLILTIHDRKGNELKFGDIVKIDCHSMGNYYTFYSEVKYLQESQSIAPFHTFAFHSVEKVDCIPDGAIASTEERYKVWYECREIGEDEETPPKESFDRYLMEWRECEHLLEQKIFRVHVSDEVIKPGSQLTFL